MYFYRFIVADRFIRERLVCDPKSRFQTKKNIEEYLCKILANDLYKNHPELGIFLEISRISFVTELGGKGKEGFLQHYVGICTKSKVSISSVLWMTMAAFLLDWNNRDHTFNINMIINRPDAIVSISYPVPALPAPTSAAAYGIRTGSSSKILASGIWTQRIARLSK